MKTFYYPAGHVAGKTMTVAELRAKLAEYPDSMPVFGGWEGVHGYVRRDSFCVESLLVKNDKQCKCLVIDVEDY